MYQLGKGYGHVIAVYNDIMAMTSTDDVVICVSRQSVCMRKSNGMFTWIPCAYHAPATTYKPHIAMLDEDTFAVSIGNAVEIGTPTGNRTTITVPCSSIACISKGSRHSIIVVTDFGIVWRCVCEMPGTLRETTHCTRLYTPCVIDGVAIGPALCAAQNDVKYFYGTMTGLYSENIRNTHVKCIVRGYVTSVVANNVGVAAICNNMVVIVTARGQCNWIHTRDVVQGQRLHLFNDLLTCGNLTVNMHTLLTSVTDANEHVICGNGRLSAIRRGSKAVVLLPRHAPMQ